jgi:hypothetical protein
MPQRFMANTGATLLKEREGERRGRGQRARGKLSAVAHSGARVG